MTTLRTLKKLLLGETWVLPLGVAAILAGGAIVRSIAPDAWSAVGGLLLAAAALLVLCLAVARSAARSTRQ
jgi:hypothetical protein